MTFEYIYRKSLFQIIDLTELKWFPNFDTSKAIVSYHNELLDTYHTTRTNPNFCIYLQYILTYQPCHPSRVLTDSTSLLYSLRSSTRILQTPTSWDLLQHNPIIFAGVFLSLWSSAIKVPVESIFHNSINSHPYRVTCSSKSSRFNGSSFI